MSTPVIETEDPPVVTHHANQQVSDVAFAHRMAQLKPLPENHVLLRCITPSCRCRSPPLQPPAQHLSWCAGQAHSICQAHIHTHQLLSGLMRSATAARQVGPRYAELIQGRRLSGARAHARCPQTYIATRTGPIHCSPPSCYLGALPCASCVAPVTLKQGHMVELARGVGARS
jgi:hypothetical protein